MRAIFDLTGADRLTFLQGMVSNDMRPLGMADGIIWAALLTPQGKYLADFFVVALGEQLLLDIDAGISEATVKRLGMYRLRADVQILLSATKVSCGLGDAPLGALPDPRHPMMGWRYYGAALNTPAVDWDALRVTHVIPETGIELIANDTYLLEAGFERLHGVDFRKGCYVGQEVTARMKHKTELRKGLAQVSVMGAAPIGTPIMAREKQAGVLFTQSSGFAIAYLRFDWASGEMTAGDAKISVVDPPD
jgi:folate-binding protein YgfZ